MKTLNFLLLMISGISISACSPKNSEYAVRRDLDAPAAPVFDKVKQPEAPKRPEFPKVVQPQAPEKPEFPAVPRDELKWVETLGGQAQLQLKPKVDILFIEDNSGSMKEVQANLARNIDRFAKAFQAKIDYRVAVLSVWDSSEKFVNNSKRKYDIGELRHVRDGKGRQLEDRFLTRDTATQGALKSTIHIGIASSSEAMPEFEEIFSTLSASIRRPENVDPQSGFFRQDAHLVVILVSDAEDSTSPQTPQQLAQELIDFKDGKPELVSAYGVLVRKEDDDVYKDYDLKRHHRYHPECFDWSNPKKPVRDPELCKEGFGPERLDQFIVAANRSTGTAEEIKSKFILRLVQKDFGEDLAKVGADISARTMEKEILLNQRPRSYPGQPDVPMIRVFYGKGEIPRESAGNPGWIYDPEDNAIRLSGKVDYSKYSDDAEATFRIEMVPVTLATSGK